MALTVVYVANAGSGTLSVLALDPEDGALETLQTVAVGGLAMPIVVTPGQRCLLVARRSEPFAVLSYAIDPQRGTLSPMGEAPLPASMAHLATDATGRWLFAASYQGEQLAVLPLDADGQPGAVQQVLATGASAHAMRASPDNRHAYATVLGADRMLQFSFDADGGRIAALAPPALALRPRSGPRHFVFHPRLPRAYLLNELDATLELLDRDPDTGQLMTQQRLVSTLPPGFSGTPWAAELRLTPDARFLYASERRSGTIAGYAIDAADGRLAPIGHWPTQAQPRSFAIDPSGRWLLAAGQLSHRVGVHRIDPASGGLTALAEQAVGNDPNWVETIGLT